MIIMMIDWGWRPSRCPGTRNSSCSVSVRPTRVRVGLITFSMQSFEARSGDKQGENQNLSGNQSGPTINSSQSLQRRHRAPRKRENGIDRRMRESNTEAQVSTAAAGNGDPANSQRAAGCAGSNASSFPSDSVGVSKNLSSSDGRRYLNTILILSEIYCIHLFRIH